MITSAAPVLSRVRDVTEEVFTALREVRDATVACLRPEGPERPGRPGHPVAADLATLRPLLWSHLTGGPLSALIAGIGFIAAPGLLADAPWYLEWWQENP